MHERISEILIEAEFSLHSGDLTLSPCSNATRKTGLPL